MHKDTASCGIFLSQSSFSTTYKHICSMKKILFTIALFLLVLTGCGKTENTILSADYNYNNVVCYEKAVSSSTMYVPNEVSRDFLNTYNVEPDMTLYKTCQITSATDGTSFMLNSVAECIPSAFYEALMKGMQMELELAPVTLEYGRANSGEYYFSSSDFNEGDEYIILNPPESFNYRSGGVDTRDPESIRSFVTKFMREDNEIEKLTDNGEVIGYKVNLSLDSQTFSYLSNLFDSTKVFPPKKTYENYEGWLTFDQNGRLAEVCLHAYGVSESPLDWATKEEEYKIYADFFYDSETDFSLPPEYMSYIDYADIKDYFE